MSICATDCGQRGAPRDKSTAARVEDDAVDKDIRIVTLR